jgi:D-alanine-D-alanine ligase-like ATP-grasp enzyme
MRDLPVYVSVEWQRERGLVRPLDSAIEIYEALVDQGFAPRLLSVDRGLPELLRRRPRAIVFPVEETVGGRAAALRAELEAAGVAYVGNDASVVAAATDKRQARALLAAAGVAVPRARVLASGAPVDADACIAELGLPLVLKPSYGRGGSDRVELLADDATARPALAAFAARADGEFLLEEYVAGDEYTVWAFGEDPVPAELVVLAVDRGGRLIFDRELKVHGDPAVDARFDTPPLAQLDPATQAALCAAAARAHRAVGAHAYSRVDLIGGARGPVVLEVNTTPRLQKLARYGLHVGRDADAFAAFVAGQTLTAWQRHQRRVGT